MNGKVFGKKKIVIENNLFRFSTQIFACNISHSKINSVRYLDECTRSSFKLPVFSCRILWKPEIYRFSKNTQIRIFVKIHPVAIESFCADGHDEPNSRFSQFREIA